MAAEFGWQRALQDVTETRVDRDSTALDLVAEAERRRRPVFLAFRAVRSAATDVGLPGRARAVRFATLAALCEALECQPGDLLRWEAEDVADELAPPWVGVTTPGATGP
jgi:hypothetical protein